MTPQEWHAQVDGTLDAIVLACTSMIATHPEKEKVLALLQALTKRAVDEQADTPETKRYKLGIRTAVSAIARGVETSHLAHESKSSPKH